MAQCRSSSVETAFFGEQCRLQIKASFSFAVLSFKQRPYPDSGNGDADSEGLGREFAVVVSVVNHFVVMIYILDFYGSGSTKMPNIKDVLVLAYDCKLLDDVEFVLLYDLNQPKNP